MVLASRSSSSAAPLSRHQRRPSYTRVYSRKRSFVVTQFPKLALLSLTLGFLLHRQRSAWHKFRSISERAPTVTHKAARRPPFNTTLSAGIRRKGVSLVSACQNHHEALRYTLPSWGKVKSLDEIILIDWSSKPALYFLVEELQGITDEDPTLYVIQVKGQDKWEPSRAFNLGFRMAHYSHILRVDCDHKVREDFILAHDLPEKAFFAGNTHLERSQSDEELFGTLFIEKKNFFQAGGYDERIQDFGGQHENLFSRLKENGLQRVDINYDKLMHNHHEEVSIKGNASFAEVDSRVEAETNVELLRNARPWNNLEAWRSLSFKVDALSSAKDSTQSRSHANVHYRAITAHSHVPSIREMTSEPALEKAKQKVTSNILLQEFEIPTEFSDIIALPDKVEVLKRLMSRRAHLSRNIIPRVLVIHCVGGFASRLLALLSGLSLAAHTDQLPIIIWQKERALITASLEELFQLRDEVTVIDISSNSFPPLHVSNEGNQKRRTMAVYDLTKEGGQRVGPIHDDPDVHVYIKSSQVIRTKVLRHTNWVSMREQLQSLTLHESIQGQLRDLEENGRTKAIGIYIAHYGHSETIDVSAFILNVRERLDEMPAGAKIYIDSADPGITKKLRLDFSNIFTAPSVPKDCNFDDPTCTRNEMTRLFALSSTTDFMSPHNNDFSTLVRLIRGEYTHW